LFSPNKVDLAGLQTLGGLDDFQRQTAFPLQPVHQAGGEAGRHVLDDYHRQREVARKGLEEGVQRGRPACGGADGDQGIDAPCARQGRKWRRTYLSIGGLRLQTGKYTVCIHLGERPESGRETTADDLDFGHQLDGRDQPLADRLIVLVAHARRFLDHLQRAGLDRVECDLQVGCLDAGADYYDRGGALRHDPLGSLEAVHHRHADVHGNQVGLKGHGFLHPFLPVGCHADHLDLRIRFKQVLQQRPQGGGVFNNQDTHHSNT
jgi:hypothetical protein